MKFLEEIWVENRRVISSKIGVKKVKKSETQMRRARNPQAKLDTV